MIKGTLKVKGQEGGITLDLPGSLAEVPLSRYIDFLSEQEKIGNEEENAILVMAKSVGLFLGIDLAELLRAQVGDVFEKEYKGLDGSLRSLYGYIAKLVGDCKPQLRSQENATFTYKGQTFRIPLILQQAIAGDVLLPDVETIEAVEAAEVQRVTFQSLKALEGLEGQQVADQRASLYYSLYLRLLAILARKDGERLPIQDAERERWINDRALFFQEIDAATALDLDFFLLGILRNSSANLPYVGFLSLLSLGLKAATLLKSGRHSTVPRTTTRRYSKRSAGRN